MSVREGICGKPNDYITHEHPGSTKKQCKQCDRFKNVIRSCLRCSRSFKPRCKTPFTCSDCMGKRVTDEQKAESETTFGFVR